MILTGDGPKEFLVNSRTDNGARGRLKNLNSDYWIQTFSDNDLGIYDVNNGLYRFYIENGGNVGAGSTILKSKLDITTSGDFVGVVDEYSDLPSSARVTISDTGGVLNDKVGFGTAFSSSDSISSGFVFGREGVAWGTYVAIHTHPDDAVDIDAYPERMRIDFSGKVGIGVVDPLDELDVSGFVRARSGVRMQYGSQIWVQEGGCGSGIAIASQGARDLCFRG